MPVVVLISGFGATRRNLTIIRKRLMRDGFHVLVLSLDWQALSDGVRGFYRLSESLSTLVLKIRKAAKMRRSKIYIVAHSAGGLVARYYVQLLGGFHYCDGLVTLATPHQGTWVAALGFFSHLILKARCLLQMLPVAPFVKRINSAGIPSDFRMVSISSPDDLLCPRSATRLPTEMWESHEVETVEIPGLSHGDFLLSKQCYTYIRAFLKDLAPPKEQIVPGAPIKNAE